MQCVVCLGFTPSEVGLITTWADLQRVQSDAEVGDSPLWFGEWGLPTQFNATDEFLYMWADAQKLAYSQSQGWIVSASALLPSLLAVLSTICESSFGTSRSSSPRLRVTSRANGTLTSMICKVIPHSLPIGLTSRA